MEPKEPTNIYEDLELTKAAQIRLRNAGQGILADYLNNHIRHLETTIDHLEHMDAWNQV